MMTSFAGAENWLHSEKKKGYQNGAPGVLLLQMVPFFQRGTLFSLIIVPLRVPYYGQSNSAPRLYCFGTLFFWVCAEERERETDKTKITVQNLNRYRNNKCNWMVYGKRMLSSLSLYLIYMMSKHTMYRQIWLSEFFYEKNVISGSYNWTIQLKYLFFCPVQSYIHLEKGNIPFLDRKISKIVAGNAVYTFIFLHFELDCSVGRTWIDIFSWMNSEGHLCLYMV